MFEFIWNSNPVVDLWTTRGSLVVTVLFLFIWIWKGRKQQSTTPSEPKKKKLDLTSEKEEEQDRLLDTLPNQDNTDYFAIFCDTLDDRILHRFTEWISDLIMDRPEITHLYIFLHVTSGGDSSDCAMICSLMLKYMKNNPENKISIIVPEIAMSSGAQIAISGSELIMGKFAHLSPFDDQLGSFGVKNVKRITRRLNKSSKQQFTLKEYDTILRAKYMRKITESEISSTLTQLNYPQQTISNVKKLFLNHKLYHSYPIDIEKIREVGLRVSELRDMTFINMFHDLYDLWLFND
jgi:hypothetical protein